MKPKHFLLSIAITANEDEWGEGPALGIYALSYRTADKEAIEELLSELSTFNDLNALDAWALQQRFNTISDEMEGEPDQEAALETLFGVTGGDK